MEDAFRIKELSASEEPVDTASWFLVYLGGIYSRDVS